MPCAVVLVVITNNGKSIREYYIGLHTIPFPTQWVEELFVKRHISSLAFVFFADSTGHVAASQEGVMVETLTLHPNGDRVPHTETNLLTPCTSWAVLFDWMALAMGLYEIPLGPGNDTHPKSSKNGSCEPLPRIYISI